MNILLGQQEEVVADPHSVRHELHQVVVIRRNWAKGGRSHFLSLLSTDFNRISILVR